jgi:predicted GIY-YIG superfamily endonuclease
MSTTHALYRFFDETGQLLYVGISVDPGRRFAQHRSDKTWWSEVVGITVQPMPSRAAALAAERAAIENERPQFNVVHNPVPPSGGAEVERRLGSILDYLNWLACGESDSWLAQGVEDAVEHLWSEYGTEIDLKTAAVLAKITHYISTDIPDLHNGVATLVDSFPESVVTEARSRAVERLRRRELPLEYVSVLERTALELAAINRSTAERSFTLAPTSEGAPF